MSSSSRRRGGINLPSAPIRSSNKLLRMDRQPAPARITDPSLPAGKRKEIDNVMRKARASSNDYWDKKLLEVEQKDPNRWRHTGYKKMYIESGSSSGSERDSNFRVNNRYRSRSRSPNNRISSRIRKTPPQSPIMSVRHRSPLHGLRQISQDTRRPKSPDGRRPPRSPDIRRRPRSPPPDLLMNRRKSPRSPRSPIDIRRRSPLSPSIRHRSPIGNKNDRHGNNLGRSKRPPSPPPRGYPSRSNSSCSIESCTFCSPKQRRRRSRSPIIQSQRGGGGGGGSASLGSGPRSPPHKVSSNHTKISKQRLQHNIPSNKTKEPQTSSIPSSSRTRTTTSPTTIRQNKYREQKVIYHTQQEPSIRNPIAMERPVERINRHSSPPEDPRLKIRPPEPLETTTIIKNTKNIKDKTIAKVRTKIKIEGEKKKVTGTSSESDDTSDSEGSLPTFAATTRLTLSERFGKMAQWSIDRCIMENMRITKDSTGGALKVMIEEELESPPRRYSYSPAPIGHFPEELATTAPTGMMSWDDVRVRYDYYKSRGYLRDLDLKDYIKWEEWWYKYQEWLKQERYYEFWERQQVHKRRRKKIPITQRLN